MPEKTSDNEHSASPPCYLRFRDLEKLPSWQFRYDNMVRAMRIATPCYWDVANRQIVVEQPWVITGWSDKVDGALMHGREGQIGLMMWHPEEGEAWEHYPLFDKEDRDEAVFVSR